ncbi:MAG: hypothetical protein AAFZ09_12425 [Pseudomonadota bacterium]
MTFRLILIAALLLAIWWFVPGIWADFNQTVAASIRWMLPI